MQINASAYIVDIGRTGATREKGGAAAAPATTAQSAVNGGERVELSSSRPDLEQLKRDLAALPDVRPERVALAKQKLRDGSYRLDGTTLARKMVGSLG